MRKRTGYNFFFFKDTATTEIYTLSLHDALPISVASKSGDATPGAAKVGIEACTTRARSSAFCGEPRTNARPSSISTSSGAASSSVAAARTSFVRIRWHASAIELPAVTALRLAKVPTPKGTAAVSPPVTVTQSSGTPRASAATWAKPVSWARPPKSFAHGAAPSLRAPPPSATGERQVYSPELNHTSNSYVALRLVQQ